MRAPARSSEAALSLPSEPCFGGVFLFASAARARELGPWLDLVAVRGDIVVPFWLQPGEAAVTLGPGEEREVERIPEQLRRYL
jgi:inner membrane protein